jgi:hypothetical protein
LRAAAEVAVNTEVASAVDTLEVSGVVLISAADSAAL